MTLVFVGDPVKFYETAHLIAKLNSKIVNKIFFKLNKDQTCRWEEGEV